jgi:hypothetical protein
MNVVELLTQARERIEQGWGQGAMAYAADGRVVTANSPSACRFCAAGAIANVLRVQATDEIEQIAAGRAALTLLSQSVELPAYLVSPSPTEAVIDFNDDVAAGRHDVLEAFDRAIELAKEAGVDG